MPGSILNKPEALAQWYLRLNGFFTITNFVVHPARRGSQQTEVDIAGVRFPHRAEFPDGPGADEEVFRRIDNRPYFVLVEVKQGFCRLNQSWQMPNEPIVALLQDLGPFAKCHVQEVASKIISNGCYDAETLHASLLFIGSKFDSALPTNAPKKSWPKLIKFIFDRFSEYRRVKTDHEQWDNFGKELWKHFEATHTSQAFGEAVMAACNLKQTVAEPILEP